MPDDFVFYICFAMSDKTVGAAYNVAMLSDIGRIRDWCKSPKSIKGENDSLEKKESPPKLTEGPDVGKELSLLMERFRSSIYGYRLVQRVTARFIPELRPAFINDVMQKHAKKTLSVVEETEGYIIYGIRPNENLAVQDQIKKLRELDQASFVLPSAILLSLVATFDSLVSDLLRIMLRIKPDRLTSSEKRISVTDVMSMSSFDEVIDRLVSDEINNFMRGSHEDQVEYIEKNLNVVIRKGYDSWGKFIEIFERRNLVAHGNLTVNDIYLKNCRSSGLEVRTLKKGSQLDISSEYIDRSADTLVEFGILTVFVVWKKHFPDSVNHAYGSIVNLTLNMIKNKRYKTASRIMQTVLLGTRSRVNESTVRTLHINYANALKFQNRDDEFKKVIGDMDWSACSENFQICIASLREDAAEVARLMPIVKVAGTVNEEDYALWPVFNWVRGDEQVRDQFKALYGKDLAMDETSGEVGIVLPSASSAVH